MGQSPGLAVDVPRAASGPTSPSRDELTKAWGDAVLGQLSQPAKLFLSNGRFLDGGTGGGAIFALPPGGLLERARDHQREAESALAAYFGRPVMFHLVPDKGANAYTGSTPAAPSGPDDYDLADLVDAAEAPPLPVVPVEERLLQAFPGSVLDG